MHERALRLTGIALLISGFTLWAYGFVYSSFWYANVRISLLEPVRVRLSEITGWPVSPGVVEEIIGLFAALSGITLQVVSYYWRR